jgi:hypothetical protein
MTEFCSCGAKLPEDALFCHKCGKPQRDLVEVEPEPAPLPTPVLPTAPVAPPRRAPVGFRNPIALRTALLSAVCALLLGFLPLGLGCIVAGFLSVFLYRRQTRDLMDVASGIQLGWITGLVTFALEGIGVVIFSASGNLTKAVTEQARNWSFASDPAFQQSIQFLGTVPGLLLLLVLVFIFVTALSIAGGALGAKLLGRG